jgi:hypothetical protein
MATPKRGIIFVQQHDHRGHDASGAFVPKSQLFKRHYGITDYNYILIDGKIQAEGEERAIRNDPHVKKYYLGQGFGGENGVVG